MRIRTPATVILIVLLSFRVSAQEPDVDTEAYEIYLKGMEYLEKGGESNLLQAIEHIKRSIGMDSTFALGYAGLSRAYSSIGGNYNILAPEETWPKAQKAAEKAIALDEGLAEGYVALALVKGGKDWDWAGAEEAFKQALNLKPNDIGILFEYGFHLDAIGRSDEANTWIEKACTLSPDSPETQAYMRWYKIRTGDTEGVIPQIQKEIASDPSSPYPYFSLALVYAKTGAYEEAAKQLKIQIPLMKGDVVDEVALLGHLYGRMGRRAEALDMLKQLDEIAEKGRYVSPVLKAWIYAGLGDKDEAFHWLQKGYETHAHRAGLGLKFFGFVFEPIREDPRYGELLGKMNLSL